MVLRFLPCSIPLLLSAFLLDAAHGQSFIQPNDFYAGILAGRFDAVIDVRRQEEWDAGHIVNATFVESFSGQTVLPDNIKGCDGSCRTIVVYCRTGARAGAAIESMLANGFNETTTIYNGQGVTQWTAAGYDLVTTDDSVTPSCSVNGNGPSCDENGGGTEDATEEETVNTKSGIANFRPALLSLSAVTLFASLANL